MLRAAVVFLLALGLPAAAAVEVVPLTDETVIADSVNGFPDTTALTFAKVAPRGGEFVVAWTTSHSRYSGWELIGWSAGISARKVAADGQPAGGALTLVPQSRQVDIFDTALAPDPSGGYAVVWNRHREFHGTSVWLRRFSPAGAGSTVPLDQFGPTARVAGPALASGADGRLFAVWGRPQPSAPTRPGLFAQLLSPAGPPTPRFQVTARAQGQGKAVVGLDGRGNAVLVYENHRRQDPFGPHTSELFLRLYDRHGQPRSGEVRLAAPFEQQLNPALAGRPDGRFVVAWLEARDVRIWARVFDPPYRPLGPAFPVSDAFDPDVVYYRDFPAVAIDREGRFVVAWRELSDGSPHVDARAFDPQGTPASAVFRADRRLGDFTLGAWMAAGENGAFLIAWAGPEREAGDRVFARLYALRQGAPGS